jgi:hypothetical protein
MPKKVQEVSPRQRLPTGRLVSFTTDDHHRMAITASEVGTSAKAKTKKAGCSSEKAKKSKLKAKNKNCRCPKSNRVQTLECSSADMVQKVPF